MDDDRRAHGTLQREVDLTARLVGRAHLEFDRVRPWLQSFHRPFRVAFRLRDEERDAGGGIDDGHGLIERHRWNRLHRAQWRGRFDQCADAVQRDGASRRRAVRHHQRDGEELMQHREAVGNDERCGDRWTGSTSRRRRFIRRSRRQIAARPQLEGLDLRRLPSWRNHLRDRRQVVLRDIGELTYFVSARIDDDGERDLHNLPVDQEGERVLVDVVVARIDRDAACAQLFGRELLHAHGRLQEVRHGDCGDRRRGRLEEIISLDQADVLQEVDALA